MNVDCYFTNGSGHEVCEDYALTGEFYLPDKIPPVSGDYWYYNIISDGCSSSPHTDVGARILVHCADHVVRCMYDSNYVLEYDTFGLQVAAQAEQICRLMRLPKNAIDATLLVMFENVSHDSMETLVYVYGDGIIFSKQPDNPIKIIKVDYEKNMPYYLSYWLDLNRQTSFMLQGTDRLVTCSEDNIVESQSPIQDCVFVFPTHSEFVGIASDGLSSFVNRQDGSIISVDEVVKQFTSFKNTSGSFVKRRVKRALSTYAKDGIIPADDVSVAMLYRG